MNKLLVQAFKYGLVGIANTLLTAVVIWIILKFGFGIRGEADASSGQMTVANFSGYALGVINSFIFNRNWTFKSKGNWKVGFLKFIAVFAVCYSIQLLVVLLLNRYALIPSLSFEWIGQRYTVTSAYLCQLAGIVVYTVLNFFCNKYYTFKK
jgi:Predicted membrane protein